jgi:hypothetical protein
VFGGFEKRGVDVVVGKDGGGKETFRGDGIYSSDERD